MNHEPKSVLDVAEALRYIADHLCKYHADHFITRTYLYSKNGKTLLEIGVGKTPESEDWSTQFVLVKER